MPMSCATFNSGLWLGSRKSEEIYRYVGLVQTGRVSEPVKQISIKPYTIRYGVI